MHSVPKCTQSLGHCCPLPPPQWRPLHMGSPYAEDYYYQAFLYKHYNKRNKRTFAPESGERPVSLPASHVAQCRSASVPVRGVRRTSATAA